ncbi:hypothetical protein FOMPIDRAFT_1026333 [Fomitopsis schrenkii]|uniref:Uncharacterized protein n=1 Tax=Fomitopsis schrenkii TaxID=2126942 RepID=S8DN10_FOMSC|nr:hypothetical protein FOMPIDRAFT_1026333 [Fomitopsis schrenkii]
MTPAVPVRFQYNPPAWSHELRACVPTRSESPSGAARMNCEWEVPPPLHPIGSLRER